MRRTCARLSKVLEYNLTTNQVSPPYLLLRLVDAARARLLSGPVDQLIGGPRVHDPVDRHPGRDRLVGDVRLPLQLTGRVRIRVDREPAARLRSEEHTSELHSRRDLV